MTAPVMAMPARPRRPAVPPRALIAVAVLLVIGIALIFWPRENRYENEARRITEAVQHNDMTPVAGDFNAIKRATFTREQVGRFSDQLDKIGKIQHVKEATPGGSAPGTHLFQVTGEHGTVAETMKYDLDGKIELFRWTAPQLNP